LDPNIQTNDLFHDINSILLEHASINTLDQLSNIVQLPAEFLITNMDRCKHLLNCLLKFYSCSSSTLNEYIFLSKNQLKGKSSIHNSIQNQQTTVQETNKPTKSYHCSKCGQLKKGHICTESSRKRPKK